MILSSNTTAQPSIKVISECNIKITGNPVKCNNVAGARIRPHDTVLAGVLPKKRKELIAGMVGPEIFVMVARKLLWEETKAQSSSALTGVT